MPEIDCLVQNNMIIKYYLKPFLLAFVFTLLITPLVIYLAKKFNFLDIPKDNRRMHNKPMPIGGGLGMYIVISILSLYFLKLDRMLVMLLIGSTIIVVSGLIDDKKSLSPKMKLLFQVLAAVCLIIGGVKIEFFTNPFEAEQMLELINLLSIPITIFWVCGITNTINLIDGLDGLAAGISMICAISMFFITRRINHIAVTFICVLVAGACLGFLPYNFNPAKIFMGDTGALYLGFMLSFITIQGVMKQAAILMMFVPLLALGVPVFDTAFAMVRRKLHGKSIVEADKGHLHHRLLAKGLNQKQTVLILYSISIIFGILANFIADFKSQVGLIVSILIIVAIILIGIFSGMISNKEE